MLDAFGELELSDAIDKVQAAVTSKVETALVEKLEAILPTKLKEQGIVTSVVAKTSPDQAAFFFDFIGRIQAD